MTDRSSKWRTATSGDIAPDKQGSHDRRFASDSVVGKIAAERPDLAQPGHHTSCRGIAVVVWMLPRTSLLWRFCVPKASLLAGLGALQLLATAPALACPGPHAEKYLVWFRQPALLPGEVAIEIDIHDFVENQKTRDLRLPKFKVKRVLRGAYDGATIEVQRMASSCEREGATGSFNQLVLVGTIAKTEYGQLRLMPRYMEYGDPIRIEADRSLDEAKGRN